MYRVANMLEMVVRIQMPIVFWTNKQGKKKSNKTRFLVKVYTTVFFICACTRRLEQSGYIACTYVHTFLTDHLDAIYTNTSYVTKAYTKLRTCGHQKTGQPGQLSDGMSLVSD